MNVYITLDNGDSTTFDDADVSFDTTVLQVVHGAETTTFPLCNVISFTTTEGVS